LCRKEHVDVILAVGGGSAIDSAKAIAIGVPYEGDFWDFYCGKASPQKKIPMGVVLTIPAAGSEGSGDTVITKEDGLLKRGTGFDLLRNEFALMNPELTFTLPDYQTACGVTDIMAHIMERYFSNTTGVDVTDRMAEGLLATVMHNVRIVLQKGDDYDARANVMWAGMVAHNNLVGVGRDQDWASHTLEHELSALCDVAHGAGLAVIFPAFLRFQLVHGKVAKIAQFANRVFGFAYDYDHPEYTALEGVNALESFFHEIGMPTSFKELGAKEEDIDTMVTKLGLGKDGKLGGFNPLSSADCKEVYKLACK
jgi:alcohol dehydrogenase YqhD (iron-dependent ADH family)